MEAVKVHMVRDAAEFPDSHDANVSPEGVAAFEAEGWVVKAQASAPLVADDPTAIPADWASKHWKQRVALAKALGWADGEPTTEQADGWIADIIEHRRREEPREDLGGLSIREAHDKLTKAGVEWAAGDSIAALLATLEG